MVIFQMIMRDCLNEFLGSGKLRQRGRKNFPLLSADADPFYGCSGIETLFDTVYDFYDALISERKSIDIGCLWNR